MTMDKEAIAETAAKVVKLSSGDWRKLSLILIMLISATCTLAFKLAERTVKLEAERIDLKNTQQDEQLKAVKEDVKDISIRLSPIGEHVVRGDDLAIKAELKELSVRIGRMEANQGGLQADNAVIKNDVGWIKNYLDKQPHPRPQLPVTKN